MSFLFERLPDIVQPLSHPSLTDKNTSLRFWGGVGFSFMLFGLLVNLAGAPPALAEWYVAGFGGITSTSKFTDVEMPTLGDTLAATTTNPDLTNPTGNPFFQLTQNLQADDVKLKQSWVAGGKLGYFFSQQGYPWLGIELEAFLTNPKIKSQTLAATQDVTRFNPTPSPDGPADTQPQKFSISRTIDLESSNLLVTTIALNGVLRYPGTILQPYIGAGIGGFWFRGTDQFDESKLVPGLNAFAGLKVKATEEWGVFFEAKYNRASVKDFGSDIGLRGNYTVLQWLGGIAYHF